MKTYTEADFARWGRAGGKKAARGMTAKQRQERSRKAGSAKKHKKPKRAQVPDLAA